MKSTTRQKQEKQTEKEQEGKDQKVLGLRKRKVSKRVTSGKLHYKMQKLGSNGQLITTEGTKPWMTTHQK